MSEPLARERATKRRLTLDLPWRTVDGLPWPVGWNGRDVAAVFGEDR